MSRYIVKALTQYRHEMEEQARLQGDKLHACCEQAERFITHRYDDRWKLSCGCVGWWEYHPIEYCPWCGERLKE